MTVSPFYIYYYEGNPTGPYFKLYRSLPYLIPILPKNSAQIVSVRKDFNY